MSYKRKEPVSIEEMNLTDYEGHHSICQFLRDIFHMTDNEEIKMKCRIGMTMTKVMHLQLKKYKALYEKEKQNET